MKRIVRVFLMTGLVLLPGCQSKEEKAYDEAVKLFETGSYQEAAAAFNDLGEFSDAQEMVLKASYLHAGSLREENQYEEAIAVYESLGTYDDSVEQITETVYQYGLYLMSTGNYDQALQKLEQCAGYKDADEQYVSAKMSYIRQNTTINAVKPTALKYLMELVEAGNEDAIAHYERYRTIKVSIVPNGVTATDTGKNMPGLKFKAVSAIKQTIESLPYVITFRSGYQFHGEVKDAVTGKEFEIEKPRDGIAEWDFMPPSSRIVFYDESGNSIGEFEAPDWDVKN